MTEYFFEKQQDKYEISAECYEALKNVFSTYEYPIKTSDITIFDFGYLFGKASVLFSRDQLTLNCVKANTTYSSNVKDKD